jgi:ComF family protein
MLRGLLDLILPPICLACDGLIATGDSARLICRRCRTRLRAPPPPTCERCGAPRLQTGRVYAQEQCEECAAWPAELSSARCAFLMHAPADRIVHQLKYRGWSALAEVMSEPMARALNHDVASKIDLITPVPTTSARRRERGYNQAELLARGVAEIIGLKCDLVLERTSSRSTQTTLQPAARGANVAGAFRVRSDVHNRLQDLHILIVDDVLTTGATVIECTDTLLAAGARCTSVLTYARAMDTRRLLGN